MILCTCHSEWLVNPEMQYVMASMPLFPRVSHFCMSTNWCPPPLPPPPPPKKNTPKLFFPQDIQFPKWKILFTKIKLVEASLSTIYLVNCITWKKGRYAFGMLWVFVACCLFQALFDGVVGAVENGGKRAIGVTLGYTREQADAIQRLKSSKSDHERLGLNHGASKLVSFSAYLSNNHKKIFKNGSMQQFVRV